MSIASIKSRIDCYCIAYHVFRPHHDAAIIHDIASDIALLSMDARVFLTEYFLDRLQTVPNNWGWSYVQV